MATRFKTVEYWFPVLTTVAEVTDTNFTQITAHLPETTKAFVSVTLDVIAHPIDTVLGNISRRQLSLSVNGAAYTVVNNVQLLTQSAEQFIFQATADFTAHFTAQFGAGIASRTVDARVLFDSSSATPLGYRNVTAKLTITYDYDDAAATHVKTVWIPLNAPVGALATTKPGTATAVIPALDTYCAEGTKTFIQRTIVVQGNTATVGTVDHSMSFEIGTAGAITSGLYEAAANSDMWHRFATVVTFATNTTHDWFLWGSVAKFNMQQAWMVVTYTFEPGATTRVLNSLMLPMEMASPGGGTTSAQAQRGFRDIWIPEPGAITTRALAYYQFFDSQAPVAGLEARLGTGAFVAYTDAATTLCGGNGFMIRNDAAYTLQRGLQTITVDVFRTDTTDLMFNLSGFFIVNYESDVAAGGVGAHTQTRIVNLTTHGTAAAATLLTIATVAPSIPEADYFITAVGTRYQYVSNSTGTPAGLCVLLERLVAEGGVGWEAAYVDIGTTDPEVGIRTTYSQVRSLFKRYPTDAGSDRMDIETARRWRIVLANVATAFHTLDLMLTYHTITYTVSGTVSDSNGGTVTLGLHRTTNGELIAETTRVGNGAYSFTWYDNVDAVYVEAYEAAGYAGRTDNGVAV